MENQLPTLIKTFEAKDLKSLELQTWSGDIELLGHDEDMIKVEIFGSVRSLLSFFLVRDSLDEFDSETQHLSLDVIGKTLKITSKPNYFHPYNWFNFQKTSFRVFLPKNIHSTSKTYGGKISLNGMNGHHVFSTWGGHLHIATSQGNLEGKTMGGRIELIKCSGKITAKTMGGNLFLADNQAEVTVNTMGGNILIQKHKGQLQATTWGGNIEANDVYGGFECTTAGGNIRLYNMHGNIGASTKGGNITADVPTIDQYAWFDTAGGKIRASLPLDTPLDLEVSSMKIYYPHFQNFEGYATKRHIKGKLNGGGPSVTIKSTGGKVTIENTFAKRAPFTDPPLTPQQGPPTIAPIKEKRIPNKQTAVVPKKLHNTPLSDIFFTLVFCLVLGYGLSSVIFFTLETVNPQSVLSIIYKGVFFTNIANGFSAFFAVYTFIYLIDNRVRFNWLKYLILIAVTFVYVSILQGLVGVLYWNRVDTSGFSKDHNSDSLYYFFLPLIVSCAYFYYWQRTRHISRKISEQEYQLLNLEKLKTKAQLNALEARINPHFLYNSLNSIAGLVHQDPDKAEEMTIQLSKLFRYSTGRSEGHSHAVAEELEIVKSYLAIEQMRFGNRLQFSIEIAPELMNVKIPRFLLQPIVENAIKHGISQMVENGRIEIKIVQKEEVVQFTIHDNGPAFKEDVGGGYGLRSIKDKLNLFYGEKAALQIQNNEYKAVCITLPMADELIEFR